MINDEIEGKKINHEKNKKNPESTRLTIKTRESSVDFNIISINHIISDSSQMLISI